MATATATRFKPVTLDTPGYAVSMTAEVFRNIFGVEPQDIHAEIETCGAWGLPVTFKAPAIHWHWKDKGYGNTISRPNTACEEANKLSTINLKRS